MIYHNNTLELVGTNKPILVVVQIFEGLPQAFSLQPFHELGKLGVYVPMSIK